MSSVYEDYEKVCCVKDVKNLAERLYGCYVIVRTYSSGVHFGVLKEFDSEHNQALLNNSRRIYSWEKAFTLSQVSQDGVGADSKLSMEIPVLFFSNVIEIIPCTKKAVENLKGIKTHSPE